MKFDELADDAEGGKKLKKCIEDWLRHLLDILTSLPYINCLQNHCEHPENGYSWRASCTLGFQAHFSSCSPKAMRKAKLLLNEGGSRREA